MFVVGCRKVNHYRVKCRTEKSSSKNNVPSDGGEPVATYQTMKPLWIRKLKPVATHCTHTKFLSCKVSSKNVPVKSGFSINPFRKPDAKPDPELAIFLRL